MGQVPIGDFPVDLERNKLVQGLSDYHIIAIGLSWKLANHSLPPFLFLLTAQ